MKRFVIDTSVLVYDPNALKNFKDNTVIISIAVLEELDKLKSGSDEKARNCRQVIRKLDEISNSGEIFKGVKIENNVTVIIDVAKNEKFGASTYGDNVLLGCLDNHTTQYPEKQVALVSKDINLRLRAKAFGMLAEDYETDKVENLDSVYSGFRTIKDKRLYEDLMEHKVVDSIDYKLRLYPNQCLQVDHLKKSILARESNGKIRLCDPPAMWGLNYRNREQVLLADLLLDTKIPLVTTMGSAGSGKTILALASALELVLEQKKYEKVILYRSIEPLGREIGHLPGTLEEKMGPFMDGMFDNLDFLMNAKNKGDSKKKLAMYMEKGIIEIGATTFIRGRSLQNTFVILDESQNISPHEMKTILTRAGEGSKFVIIGDAEQIDSPYLDSTSNGLSILIEKFKSSKLAGHITLTKGERSALATEAAEIL